MAEEKTNGENQNVEQEQEFELPPVTFENFILGLYNTALIHMGHQDPESGEIVGNLQLARHTIDTMVMIQEKTKGNTTAPESNLLENILYELRMNYLRVAKSFEEAKKEKPAESKPEDSEGTGSESEKNDTEKKAEEEK
ncbi:DUF1844 domain-containing protein [Candidatus Poribacteria bacterium]|nr:DUF1844 domain-containing protein [Candidatus Poribacteria bacterium]